MVKPVDGAGGVDPRKISKSGGARSGEVENISGREGGEEEGAIVRGSGDLQRLVGRIRAADDVRKSRVHEVKDLVNNDELVTEESIRNAAEKLLAEEL